MGGLVARSAFRHGSDAGHAWTRQLKNMVFLGTPHLGAPLERLGGHIDRVLGLSPYTAPLARLGGMRSAGIRDLRNGGDEHMHWPSGHAAGGTSDPLRGPTLPRGVRCFAVAATRQVSSKHGQRLRGDGLVSVASAFGQYVGVAREPLFPESGRYLCHGANHFGLLSRTDVHEHVRAWLAGAEAPGAAC